MTAMRLHASRPAPRVRPRPVDPTERRRMFGPIRPMEQPSLVRRLLRLI